MAVAGLPDQLHTRLEQILDTLLAKDVDRIFSEPVSKELYPTYFDLISIPMDLGTIKRKLAQGCYSDKPSSLERTRFTTLLTKVGSIGIS